MYSHKIGISTGEHDNFVKLGNQTSLLQSSNWAKIEDNRNNERVGFYKDDTPAVSASILIKALPLGFTMFHTPRGPIMSYNGKELVTFVINSLKEYSRTKRFPLIEIGPTLLLEQYRIGEEADENKNTFTTIDNLRATGYEWTGRITTVAESIQPRFQVDVCARENMTVAFPKHTKCSMKDAIHHGVITSRGAIDGIRAFADVVAPIGNRKGVALRNENYFHKIMETCDGDAHLHLAKVNLSKHLAEYKEQLAQIKKSLSETTEYQKKRLTKST